MSKELTAGTPWRVIVAFAVPLLIGNVVQQLYQFADAVVVGRQLGVQSLAAVGATTSTLFLLLGFAWGLTTGFAIPTAQAFGARDYVGVRRSVANGAVLTAAVSVALTLLGSLLVGPALELLRTPPELLADATTFARTSFLGVGALMFFNYLAAIIRAVGDSRTPLMFLVISCVLNVALVVAFIGPLALGIAGAAVATAIAQLVSVLLCLAHVRRRVPVLHVRRDDWRVDASSLWAQLRLGLPLGFQTSIIAAGSIAVQMRLNSLGPDVVAGYTSYVRVDGLAVALLQSLGLAVSTYVAQNYGARRVDRIRLGVSHALRVAAIASVLIGVVLFAASRHLVEMFVGERAPEVVEFALMPLHINASLYWVLGVLFVLRGALQGLGRTAVPVLTGVIELGMRLITAIILGAAFGYAGVVWGTPLAWAGAVALLLPAYAAARRRLLEPIDPTATQRPHPGRCPGSASRGTQIQPATTPTVAKTPGESRLSEIAN